MATTQVARYGIGKSFKGNFQDALGKVKEAFKQEGFGVITEIDLKETLFEKIGEKIEPYHVFGMCNPNLASHALSIEHEIGMLLPCNVIVHECKGEVHVSAQDPELMMDLVGKKELRPIAEEAKKRILRALDSI